MTEPTNGPDPDIFVPTSFEDLRRVSPEESRRFARETQIRSRKDLGDLIADGGFMQQSKWIALAAVAIGAILVGAAYVKPFFETADAVQTASSVAADKVTQQVSGAQGALGGVAAKAVWVKATDAKAIDTAKSGLACLTGKSACPNGASSPFR